MVEPYTADDPAYTDTQGRWAPGPQDVNAQRDLIHAQFDRWPKDPRENGDGYLEVPQRLTVEKLHANPDEFPASGVYAHTAGPDPRWTPPQPQRKTRTPSVFRFFRPFQQDVAWGLTGDHFSMATWSRRYPIHGMEPIHEARNTYRIDPPQRGLTIRDEPENYEPDTAPAIYVSPQAAASSRAFRLGG